MTTWIARGLFAVLLSSAAPAVSSAQGPDIGVTGAGLLSIQPVDDSYVGGPYLNAGLGGVTMGVGASLTAIANNRLLLGAEFSTARYEVEQSGRLVNGSGINEGQAKLSELRDSLLVGLVGRVAGSGRARTQFVAGAGVASTSIARDGVTQQEPTSAAFTGGADVLLAASSRVAFVLGARYTFIARDESATFRGIGKHVIRAGAGLRIRLN
jgi:hypothetical protein